MVAIPLAPHPCQPRRIIQEGRYGKIMAIMVQNLPLTFYEGGRLSGAQRTDTRAGDVLVCGYPSEPVEPRVCCICQRDVNQIPDAYRISAHSADFGCRDLRICGCS